MHTTGQLFRAFLKDTPFWLDRGTDDAIIVIDDIKSEDLNQALTVADEAVVEIIFGTVTNGRDRPTKLADFFLQWLKERSKNAKPTSQVEALQERVQELEVQCDRLKNVLANPNIESVEINEGLMAMGIKGGITHLFASAFAAQFKESGAVNYLEMSLFHEDTGPLVVTLQRKQGKTAHELRREAEAEIEKLRQAPAVPAKLHVVADQIGGFAREDAPTATVVGVYRDAEVADVVAKVCGIHARAKEVELDFIQPGVRERIEVFGHKLPPAA